MRKVNPKIGVNVHRVQTDQLLRWLVNDGWDGVRVDLNYDDNAANTLAWYKKLKDRGLEIEVAMFPQFQWDNSGTGNTATIYTQSYDQTFALIDVLYPYIDRVEILNEIWLRSEITAQVPWNSQQLSTAGYEASSAMDRAEAAAKGIADAVAAVNSGRGTSIQRILGAGGRDFGFLTHMSNVGVNYEWVGYHSYQDELDPLVTTDTWFGTGGCLTRLAAFSKPVTINEMNDGRVYNMATSADDADASALSLSCEVGHLKQASAWVNAKGIDLRCIMVYEITNRDAQGVPENYFGLRRSTGVPKRRLRWWHSMLGGIKEEAGGA